jgi:hypothetical protein
VLSNYQKNIIINVFTYVSDIDDKVGGADWDFILRKDLFRHIVQHLNDTGIKTSHGKVWTQRRWRDFCLSLRNDKEKEDVVSALAEIGISVGEEEEKYSLGYRTMNYSDLVRWKSYSDWTAKRTGALTKGDEHMDEWYVRTLVMEDRQQEAERNYSRKSVSKRWSESLGQNTRKT